MGERRIAVRRTLRRRDAETVWEALADIPAHVEWMADAEAIRFTSSQHQGVGTAFECDTKVGPFRLCDHMEVTRWEPPRTMSVRHAGVVTGEGTFTVQRRGNGTIVRWDETLRFPWWIPSAPAAVALHLIWRGNLRRFERTLPPRSPADRPVAATAGRGARRRGRRRRRGP